MTQKNKRSISFSPSLQSYSESQFSEAIQRLLSSNALPMIAQSYFSDFPYDHFVSMLEKVKNVDDFQEKFISKAVDTILKKTSQGLTTSGFENLSQSKKYLFISNHRDIICDPALLTNSLFLKNFKTPKICLGDNLLTHPLIIDLVKMNKGITVKRNQSPRDLLANSIELSHFIFDQIKNNIDSIWIAQREGRAKNGDDQTQQGIIKMLTLSKQREEYIDQLVQLHIVPVSIAYEYDPCDALKARELHILDTQGNYHKGPQEDAQSIMIGINQFKGRIHIALAPDMSERLKQFSDLPAREQIKAVVEEIDQAIHKNYHLWPSNYIAYDLLNKEEVKTPSFSSHYTSLEQKEFTDRMLNQLNKLNASPNDLPGIRRQFLSSYAFPVKNSL